MGTEHVAADFCKHAMNLPGQASYLLAVAQLVLKNLNGVSSQW